MTDIRHARRALTAVAAVTACSLLAACSSSEPGETDESAPVATSDATTASDCGFPQTIAHPFGTTEIPSQPQTVAVVTDIDLDIAIALGVEPVIAPGYELGTWQQGAAEVPTYEPWDGIDFEAIAAVEPDVILATSGWTLENDYDKLASIAPVVPYDQEGGLAALTWEDRTTLAGCALGLDEQAQAVIDGVHDRFAQAAVEHPEFEGTTFTYSVIHPDQVTYSSHQDSDNSFFTALGFELAETAQEFNASNEGLSLEQLDKLEADVLVVGYPFGDEGLITRDALESDPLFTSLDVVRNGGYTVLGDDVASPIAYPSPLGLVWALEQALPGLAEAAS